MSDTTSDLIASATEIRTRMEARFGEDLDPRDLAREMHDARQLHDDALQALHRQAGDRALTASEQRKWDAHSRAARELEEAAAELEHRADAERDAATARRRAKFGFSISGGGSSPGPWSTDYRGESPAGWVARGHAVLDRHDGALSTRAGDMLAEALASREGPTVAQALVARSNPHYESGFLKMLSSPDPARAFFSFTPEELGAFNLVESVRASMSTNVGTAGYLLPLSFDPNVASIANAGAASPFRQLATVRTTASSPHRAVTSAGITAAWVAENTAIGDASPTFVGKDVALHKLAAFITGSYEIFADAGTALREQVPMLLADARDRLEADAFVNGSGSGAPKGIITAISATVGCTVTATTRAQFTSASAVDTFALLNALTPRIRQSSSVAAIAHNDTIVKVRQQVVGTTGVALTDMSAAVPSVLGVPFYEASSVTNATTSGNVLAVAGDLSAFLIVDHIQGPSLEFIQNVVDGDGIPTGTRGWVYWSRTGADVLDLTKFRFLLA